MNAAWFRERDVQLRNVTYIGDKHALRHYLDRAMSEINLPHVLRYEDRNSMAHSVESRVPFLTPTLVDLVLSLLEEHVIFREGTSKALFRSAMRGIVPDSVLDRRDKIGFETPGAQWLRSLGLFVRSVLSDERLKDVHPLHATTVEGMWTQLAEGRSGIDPRVVWRWVNLTELAGELDVRFA